MSWVEVFAVFCVSHAVGDFLLQTEFQAVHKRGGLGGDATARRALLAHTLSHARLRPRARLDRRGARRGGRRAPSPRASPSPTACRTTAGCCGAYTRAVKHADPRPGMLMLAVDQSFHLVVLFALAVAAAAA